MKTITRFEKDLLTPEQDKDLEHRIWLHKASLSRTYTSDEAWTFINSHVQKRIKKRR